LPKVLLLNHFHTKRLGLEVLITKELSKKVSLGVIQLFLMAHNVFLSMGRSIRATAIGSMKQTKDSTGEEPRNISKTKNVKP